MKLYLSAMKRIACFLVALIFPGILLMGQGEAWLDIPDAATGVSVEMPSLPKFEKITIYYDQKYVPKEIFSLRDNDLDYIFESQQLPDMGKKVISKAMNNAVDLKAIQLKGKPVKKESMSKNGVNYRYVAMELSSGKLSRSVLFAAEGKLFHLYVVGDSKSAFSLDANYYLGSWKLGEKIAVPVQTVVEQEDVSKKERKKKRDKEKKDIEEIDWIPVTVNEKITVEFPGKPFRRTTVVEMGRRDIIVTAYSRMSDQHNLNYVLTHRDFGKEEGQLSNENLYQYTIEQIREHNSVKVISISESASSIGGREYVLSKGIRFYKLHLFRVDDTIYQAMVKGKRKNIDQAAAARFFDSIKTLN